MVFPTDKAHLFIQYFFSVFMRDSSVTLTTSFSTDHTNTLGSISISSQEVCEALASLDPNKAQGIECLSSKIWKICVPYWLIHCITLFIKVTVRTYDKLSTNITTVNDWFTTRSCYSYLTVYSTISFLPKQSTTQQLLLVLNTIHKATHASEAVDILCWTSGRLST